MRYIALAFLLFLPCEALALNITTCNCGDKPTIEKESKRAFAIFTGTVKNIRLGLGAKRRTKVTFDVHRSWKGARHETISVYAAGADVYSQIKESFFCNYQFAQGQTYMVMSHRKKNRKGLSFVSNCGNTMPYASATSIISRLGEPILVNSEEPKRKQHAVE